VWGIGILLLVVTLACTGNWILAVAIGALVAIGIADVLFGLRVPDERPRRPGWLRGLACSTLQEPPPCSLLDPNATSSHSASHCLGCCRAVGLWRAVDAAPADDAKCRPPPTGHRHGHCFRPP